jgi:hypothetical protein
MFINMHVFLVINLKKLFARLLSQEALIFVDLHQELAVRTQKNLELEKTAVKSDVDGKKDDKTKSHIKKDIKTDSVGTSPHKVQNGGTPLAPSARISALNIVGDLLRKVGVSFC